MRQRTDIRWLKLQWLYFENARWTISSSVTYRSICRSFLFPTSIIGTLQHRWRHNYVIQVWHVPHILQWQTNRYLLDLSHHVQQFFMDHLYDFKAERNEGKAYFTAAGMPWISDRIWADLWKRTFCLMWLNRPGYSRWCLWSRSVGRWNTHPRDRHSEEDVSLQYLTAKLKNNALALKILNKKQTEWKHNFVNTDWYLSSCVHQLKMVLLSIYCDHFSERCSTKDKGNEEHN